MSKYFVKTIEIKKLWGTKKFTINFFPKVSILIGENGTGKTTILNLLYYILSVDIARLSKIDFQEATVKLTAFEGDNSFPANKIIRIIQSDNDFKYVFDDSTYTLINNPQPSRFLKKHRQSSFFDDDDTLLVRDLINKIVPSVWLPVSRRLPIPVSEIDRMERHRLNPSRMVESVDESLHDLLSKLVDYRLKIDIKLSKSFKEFEKRVLGVFIYNKNIDTLKTLMLEKPFTKEEKGQLERAFTDAGLLDTKMKNQLQEHFKETEKGLKRVTQKANAGEGITFEDIFILPLISRTKEMILFARELEEYRETLFAPLRRFEKITSDFLANKKIIVTDEGHLLVSSSKDDSPIHINFLSSGEKQILILLTQALLNEDEPVVYIADEPELSLHVEWQRKLLKSLIDLGNRIQIIVATHSPDIAGPFPKNLIELPIIK